MRTFFLPILVLEGALSLSGAALAQGPGLHPIGELSELIDRYQLLPAALAIDEDLSTLTAIGEWRADEALERLLLLSRVFRRGSELEPAHFLASAALSHVQTCTVEGHPFCAGVLLEEGLTARVNGLNPRAERAIEQGLVVVGGELSELRADLEQALGNRLRRSGPAAEVAEHYRLALQLRRKVDVTARLPIVDNLTWLAHQEQVAGNEDAAYELLLEADQMLQSLGLHEHPLIGPIAHALGTRENRLGNCAAFTQLLRRSMEQELRTQAAMPPGFARNAHQPRGYLGIVPCLIQLEKPEEAFESFLMGFSNLSGGADWLARRASPVKNASLVLLEQSAEQDAAFLRSRFPFENEWPVPADEAALQRVIAYAHARIEAWRLHSEIVAEWQPDRPELPSRKDVANSLAGGEAAICFATNERGFARGQTYALVLRKGMESNWVRLEVPTRALQRAKTRLRRASSWPARVREDAALEKELRSIYESCFEPLLPELEGVDALIVVPCDLDPDIPLGAWIDGDGKALLEQYAIRYAPGPEILFDLHAESIRPVSAVVVADPTYGETRNRQKPLDPRSAPEQLTTVLSRELLLARLEQGVGATARLPRLPFSAWEADQVAENFETCRQLVGPDASEAQVDGLASGRALREADVIHIASHALVHPRFPERSAIALGYEAAGDAEYDGLLGCNEIRGRWSLDAELVTLSGCQTAGSSGPRFQPAQGLAQIFLQVGARSVVSSRWKVDDAATALLMARFYANWSGREGGSVAPAVAAPLTRSQALQEACLWLRDYELPDGQRPFEHPVYWSAFALSGASEVELR